VHDPVRVNFARPIPLFPLAGVALLPQHAVPLHIFEPRYRQMVSDAIDGSGLIAMAVYDKPPALRPAVCVGHIVQYDSLPDGRSNIVLQGICRARILRELPMPKPRTYRTALLEPIDAALGGELSAESAPGGLLDQTRDRVLDMLTRGPLTRLHAAQPIANFLQSDEGSSSSALELVCASLVDNARVRYQLLEEPNPAARAKLLLNELTHLQTTIRRATSQRPDLWPKGMSWN
jgi:hypothetical protein